MIVGPWTWRYYWHLLFNNYLEGKFDFGCCGWAPLETGFLHISGFQIYYKFFRVDIAQSLHKHRAYRPKGYFTEEVEENVWPGSCFLTDYAEPMTDDEILECILQQFMEYEEEVITWGDESLKIEILEDFVDSDEEETEYEDLEEFLNPEKL